MSQDLNVLFGLQEIKIAASNPKDEFFTEVEISGLPHELDHVPLIEQFYHNCANANPNLEDKIGAALVNPSTLVVFFAFPVKESFLRQKLEPLITDAIKSLGKTSGYGLSFTSENTFAKNLPSQQQSLTSGGPDFV